MSVKYLRFFALSLLVFCSAQARLQAQSVYRCGNSYSQTPCPGSMPVDVADDRSKTQKAQADAASQRDRRTAEAMEKSRLKQEASQARAAGAQSGAQSANKSATTGEQASADHKARAGKKGKKPEYFTASTAGEKSKKKKDGSTPSSKTGSENKPAAAH